MAAAPRGGVSNPLPPSPGEPLLAPGDFVAITNQVLERAYPSVLVRGEVDSFTVSHNKYVFFTLKDAEAAINCFMMVYALRVPVEDGMTVVVRARPKLTAWGKFSLTIDSIRPCGEGALRRSQELLKARLDAEGLFAPERKRPLPAMPRRVAIISSQQAAGYTDFMRIADERWGGVAFTLYHTPVQGEAAAGAMVQAIKRANQQEPLPDCLVLVRGGGSADDLACFNDEALVRAIAASRVPTLVGVGHEVDTTLADLAADARAATPTHAATMLLPDRHQVAQQVAALVARPAPQVLQAITSVQAGVQAGLSQAARSLQRRVQQAGERVAALERLASSYDPQAVLARGYAIIRGPAAGAITPGATIHIRTHTSNITAKVLRYDKQE